MYNGSEAAKETHLHTVIEVLQSIKASEMTPMLQRIYAQQGGSECLDVLMKYLYVLTGFTSFRSATVTCVDWHG